MDAELEEQAGKTRLLFFYLTKNFFYNKIQPL